MELESILKIEDRLEAYMGLAKLYLNGSPETRTLISEKFPFGVLWKFPWASKLACQNGQRWSSRERAEALAAYYGIASKKLKADWDYDYRDVLVVIGREYNGFLLAGLKPEEIYGKVIPLTTPDIQKILTDFLSREDDEKSLKAWCLKVVRNKSGELELKDN